MLLQGVMSFTLFFLAFMAFMIFQRLYQAFRKRDIEKGDVKEGWTFTALFISHSILVIATLAEYFFFTSRINYLVSFGGLFIYSSGLILRDCSIKALGRFHSLQIEIRKNHSLIKDGPYRVVRNPYYLSAILEILGFPLVANAYYTFCLGIVLYLPLMAIRIYFEEKELLNKFGREYMDYKNQVSAFLPGRKLKSKHY